jgi:hypothetical protein
MKKLLVLIALFVVAPCFAQSTSQSGASSGSSSDVKANQGNAQNTNLNIISNQAPIPTSQSVHYSGLDREAPAVISGGYAAGFSSDNCMNTAQVGVSGPGFGVSAGKGVADTNCQLLRRVDAHGRLAQAYGITTAQGRYQLQQAAIDACVADGYEHDSCVKANTPY